MKNVKWTVSTYGRGIPAAVPRVSGIYAIGRVGRLHGLITDIEWLYVGQSRDMRRRYEQHTHRLEPNPALEAIRDTYDHEFWWIPVTAERLDSVERELIFALQPPGNTLHRKGKAG